MIKLKNRLAEKMSQANQYSTSDKYMSRKEAFTLTLEFRLLFGTLAKRNFCTTINAVAITQKEPEVLSQ